jgi:hypothetical protein
MWRRRVRDKPYDAAIASSRLRSRASARSRQGPHALLRQHERQIKQIVGIPGTRWSAAASMRALGLQALSARICHPSRMKPHK